MARLVRLVPALLFVFLLHGCSSAVPKEPITLSHIHALSGPGRESGRDAQQAVLLAVEEINADDKGIIGRPLVVREIDTAGNPETAREQTVRLLSLQRSTAVIAGPDAASADEVARAAHAYVTTVIVAGELPETPRGDGVLVLGADPHKRGEVLSTYAATELKAKRVILLTDKRDPVGKIVATGFQDAWPRASPAATEEWASADLGAEKDLPKRLTDAKADVVLICGSVGDFLKIRAQCAAEKFAAPLIFGGEDDGIFSIQGSAAGPDVYLATISAPDGLTDKGKAFAKKYEDRFHAVPSLAAIQAYDAVRLVAEAMQQSNSTSALDLKAHLNRMDKFESLLGTVTWKDHVAKRPVFLARLHDKETTIVKTVKAE
jgi:ABC-type branched-subunit amino acid transport system substrate-binding protein